MARSPHAELSRRERQIMDVLWNRGRATAQEVRDTIADPPGYSAVRALLRILEEKGHVRHEQDGPRYVFLPTIPREKARRSALRDLMRTFFDDNAEKAVAALLDLQSGRLDQSDYDRLASLIAQARKEGR